MAMADAKFPKSVENASPTAKIEMNPDNKPAERLRPPNPMWKYLGFGENFRPRIPSRNWLIFLSATGSFTAAVIYDKREKKRAQRKWCKLVEHIAREPLDPKSMPRKLTVFLEGPPTDGLRVAQDHFKEYVKPILVASGLDWEFIQGRKEGDIRAELAEKIRNQRLPPGQKVHEDLIAESREKSGIKEFDGPRGDIVIGRHTWKEYVRGLHEGWLGPLIEPPKIVEEQVPNDTESLKPDEPTQTLPGITIHSTTEGESDVSKEAVKTDNKPQKPPQPSPFISTAAYSSAAVPVDMPQELDPSTPISFPHVLGFLNTPKRLYRFLNRRALADHIGRETAAIILSNHRPYHTTSNLNPESSFASDDPGSSFQTKEQETAQASEQQAALVTEEQEWHKNARKRSEEEPERTWLEPVVLDWRIAGRMRKAELTTDDEIKARSIIVPEEEVEGWIKGGIRSLARDGLQYLGFGKEKLKKYTEDDQTLD